MLPVREMILYKHGVGFFVRGGEVDGTEIELTFRQDDLNDILKSLTVIDRSGGQILGIHYATPIPQTERLATTSFDLSDTQALYDMMHHLRGRQVQISLQNGQKLAGIWVGINLPTKDSATLGILQGETTFFYDLQQIQSLTLSDSTAADLAYYLHHSLKENDRRAVILRLSEGKHDLLAHYVAPAPTWRVSYRVIAEQAEGKLLLQGWGLFDNRLEEDLEGVKLTFVAGQPISFIYDLYSSTIPQRPKIQDEARIAPQPPQFRGGSLLQRIEKRADDTTGTAPMMARSAAAPRADRRIDFEEVVQSTPVQAETQEAGELFQYIVNTPVTVKRGESALVPILSQTLGYERELLYNGAKLPQHPVSALRFQNTTGLTLERGPVTLVEDGDYKGEAILPFSKAENEVYLPYAVELGVNVRESHTSERESFHFRVTQKGSFLDEYETNTTTYTLENTLTRPITLLVEAAKRPQHKLFESPQPITETLNEQRWQVEVPAQTKIEFKLRYRRVTYRQVNLQNLSLLDLQQYLKNQYLDQALFGKLSELVGLYAEQERYNILLKDINQARDKDYQQQGEVRENLKALTQTDGEEGQLRARMLKKLADIQDHLDTLDEQESNLQQEGKQLQAHIAELVETLNDSE